MKDPFLEDCGGWTPAPDVLTRNSNYGFEGAYLWGRIRRLCQIGKGSYTISHGELGKRIGMSRRTVIKYLDRLIEDGYIEDLTPGVRNKAHTYSVKQGEAKILVGMQISHTESDMLQDDNEVIEPEGIDVGMRNLHSDDAEIAHLDPSGMQKLHTEYAEFAQPGMQNLHLKRESLDTSSRDIKDSSPNGEVPPPLPKEESIKIEYTTFLRDFLARFNAKRFRNQTQFKTVSGLVEQHGEAELESLAEWAANKGMGLGQAIPAIKSALKNPKRTKPMGVEAAWESPPDPIPPPARTPEQLIWQQVLADSPQIPQWLAAEIKPITRSNGTFKLAVSSDSAKQWIDNRLVKVIKPTLNRIDQSISEIEVIVNPPRGQEA